MDLQLTALSHYKHYRVPISSEGTTNYIVNYVLYEDLVESLYTTLLRKLRLIRSLSSSFPNRSSIEHAVARLWNLLDRTYDPCRHGPGCHIMSIAQDIASLGCWVHLHYIFATNVTYRLVYGISLQRDIVEWKRNRRYFLEWLQHIEDPTNVQMAACARYFTINGTEIRGARLFVVHMRRSFI